MPKDMIYPDENADTRLLNISNHETDKVDVYISDANESVRFDESPLRNPFDESEIGTLESMENYRLYFYRRYLEEPEFRKLVHQLEGETLGCWCYPDFCHGQVIVDFVRDVDLDDEDAILSYIQSDIEGVDDEHLAAKGYKQRNRVEELLSKFLSK